MVISDHYVSEIAPILDEIVVVKDNTIVVHKAADTIREESGQSIEDYYESLYGRLTQCYFNSCISAGPI